MEKCTLYGHANLFSLQTLRIMELLRRHDPHSFVHSVQTTSYFIDFCLHYNFRSLLKRPFLESVLLHDIGKLLVPTEILQKKSPLTLYEKEYVEQHPEFGIELLNDFPEIDIEPSLILNHHENSDGTGYPYQLHDEQIPRSVSILRVIDSFIAMTSDRAYRPKRSEQSAIHEINAHRNNFYEPSTTSLFISYLEKRLKGKKILLHYFDYAKRQN
ncbi:HD-GYP domain-containing protein [Guptibacillus hwajinpoensis]|uniref:HD-GYP domain-containing protein n=1 Tax=Guptibacillus hwajinpoensis TaxID=208199 RepID=UPI0024B34F93|nr:HD domain-containing phosphohydrolase [Pseudalkalibacillus hwajinpoensis]